MRALFKKGGGRGPEDEAGVGEGDGEGPTSRTREGVDVLLGEGVAGVRDERPGGSMDISFDGDGDVYGCSEGEGGRILVPGGGVYEERMYDGRSVPGFTLRLSTAGIDDERDDAGCVVADEEVRFSSTF